MEEKDLTIIKNESIKLNDTISKRLSLISVTIQNVNTRKLKLLPLEIRNEFWSLLKKTKTKIKTTKDAVDILKAVCVKWNEILLLHNDAQTLNKNKKEYISDYVPQQFDEYFAEDYEQLKMVQNNWSNFNSKVARAKVKRTKTAEVSEHNEAKDMTWNPIIVCPGIGLLIGGILVFPFSSSSGIYALGAILIVIGVILLIFGVYNRYKPKTNDNKMISAGSNATDKDYQSLDDVEPDETKEEKVAFLSDMDQTPPPSFKILEPIFETLRQQINEGKVVKELQNDIENDIIVSIKKLQDACQDLMQQISSAQDAHN